MVNFPAGPSTFRTHQNINGQVYDPLKTTTIYAEDLDRIEDELVAVEEYILDGDAGVTALLLETINLNQLNSRGVTRVKYNIFKEAGASNSESRAYSVVNDDVLHVSVGELTEDTIVSKITINIPGYTATGNLQLGIYDAYTGMVVKRVEYTGIASLGLKQLTIPEIVLPASQYMLAWIVRGGADLQVDVVEASGINIAFNDSSLITILQSGVITGYVATALPDMLDIGLIAYEGVSQLIMCRLDG